MKKFSKFIILIIFVVIFATCGISFIVTKSNQKFYYQQATTNISSSGSTYKIYLSLFLHNNSGENLKNSEIKINFSTSKKDNVESIVSLGDLNEGANIIAGVEIYSFAYGNYQRVETINSIQIKRNNNFEYIYEGNSFINDGTWFIFTATIVSFVAMAATFFITISNNKIKRKQDEFETAISNNYHTIYNNVENKPFETSNNNGDEKKKVICPYCKSRYSTNLDNCPRCGAPPEH